MLRPALEAALAVARAGVAATPPEPAPTALRPVLKFAKVSRQALTAARRAVDADEAFRARVLASVDEAGVGRPAWLWLARPEGWEAEVDALVAEVEGAESETDARRERDRLRSELTAANGRAEAAEAELASTVRALATAQADLVREQDVRAAAEAAAQRATDEVATLTAERSAAIRQMKVHEASDAEVRAERRVLRARVRELEREVDRLGQAQVGEHWDHQGLLAALGDLRSQVSALSGALDAAESAVGAVGPSPGPDTHVARSERRPTRSPRRRPVRVPLIVDDTPEAAVHLLRLPDVVVMVDGYNLSMAAWPTLPLVEQRDRLLDALRELHARIRSEVVVVFDGTGATQRRVERLQELQVLFTPTEQIADDRIMELVEEVPAARPVVVVTSDRELQARVAVGGANVVSSEVFLTVLGR